MIISTADKEGHLLVPIKVQYAYSLYAQILPLIISCGEAFAHYRRRNTEECSLLYSNSEKIWKQPKFPLK